MTWYGFINQELIHIGDVHISVKNILLGIAVLVGTWVSVWVLRRVILKPRFLIDKIDSKRRNSIFLIIKFIGWGVSIFIAMKVLGVDISALLFGSTAVLIGLGFGLQNIFKDFVSGLFLLFEGSLKIGDVVEVDGTVGKVMEINQRSSEIRTRDDVTIIIPNSKFIAEKVTNWSHDEESVRFTVHVNVAYGSDVEKVFSCLESAMENHKMIEARPIPFVRFTQFGESALEFEMMFWSNNTFRIENVKSDLRRVVYKKLAENNLAIPFPQRDIHIKGMEHMINFKQKESN